MTKLVTLSGVPVEAEDSAVAGMVNCGLFRLAAGEVMPAPMPEPKPVATEPAEVAALDRGAFGAEPEDGGEDLQAMKAADLRALAKELGAKVPANASKAKLVEIIESVRG